MPSRRHRGMTPPPLETVHLLAVCRQWERTENALPVWSPDGRYLAFASQSGEGTSRRFEIRKVAANGVGTEEELAPGTDRPLMPTAGPQTR